MNDTPPVEGFQDYARRLRAAVSCADWPGIESLARAMQACWRDGHQVFVCGNGGSAANALHIANDMFYGAAGGRGPGLRIHALPANVSVLTCLANDEGYASVFSRQLAALARAGDLLIALSGSGNSANILAVLEQARQMEVKSFAVLGYSGGKARTLADVALHFPVDDMQIAEDLQLIVGHMIMQWLCAVGPGG